MLTIPVLVLIALAAGTGTPDADPVAAALLEATVSGIYEEPIELVDGRWTGEPFVPGGAARPDVVLVPYLRHVADFDADGQDEVMAYLEESAGGTGHLLFAALFEVQGDSLVSRAVHRIGDREQIRASRVEGRTVVLDLVAHGPNDAGCCPNQLQRRHLSLARDGRIEERREVLGRATTDLLDGTAWTLRSFTFRGDELDVEVVVRFDGERVFGLAGCNRFEATFRSPRRRELEIGPPIATRMACPPETMAVEERFLAALQRVSQWNHIAGRLALLYQKPDGSLASLILSPR